MKVSVCMATYNGVKYLEAQLRSILSQLGCNDEVIIVDDASTDDTVKLVRAMTDGRIKLLVNSSNQGVSMTFQTALNAASGDVIFLSDQDDIWLEGKVDEIKGCFTANQADLIVHDALVCDNNGVQSQSLFAIRRSRSGVVKNILSNTYTGCCMAFRRQLLKRVLPIPGNRRVLHDAWIGILANYYGYKILFLNKPFILFQRHGSNASTLKRRNISSIMSERITFTFLLFIHVVFLRFCSPKHGVQHV